MRKSKACASEAACQAISMTCHVLILRNAGRPSSTRRTAPQQIFRRITFSLIRPGVSGGAIPFIHSFGEAARPPW